MRIITRTVYGSLLQTSLLLGLPLSIAPNSTLNEKFDVQSGVSLSPSDVPKVGYYCIGNGGHRVVTGSDGIPYTSPVNHRARDAALFNHLPFVLREVDNDLSIAERARYALRRAETHNGRNYFAYYLKRIDVSNVNSEMNHTVVRDGVAETVPFEPTNDDLNPQQPELPPSGVISTDGSYLSSSAIIPIDFTQRDVEELINVSRVLYDNENRAVISEIGLCTGVDRTVTGSAGGSGSFNYKEAIAVQIASHITGYYPIGFTNRGFDLQIEAGATEPMLGEDSGSMSLS